MSEQNSLPTQIQALPDGGAELHLVVRMRWEDIATLGREAGRLAVRLQRPVSLDEAAGHKLSGRSAATAHDLAEQAPRALPVAPPPAETAAPHPNGTATAAASTPAAAPPQPAGAPASPVSASTGQLGETAADGRGAFDRAARVSAVPSGVPSGVAGGVPTLPGRHEAPRAAG